MPRLPELTIENAPLDTRKLMEAQPAMFGMVLNPLKLMGYCPMTVEGQAALARGIDQAGNIKNLRPTASHIAPDMHGCPQQHGSNLTLQAAKWASIMASATSSASVRGKNTSALEERDV